ncbi:hypothetical protein K1719_014566 [Acacia pycnantha]|nr:hypothetical protein K1719_014566 [Acacia pycnantha]
MNKTFFSDVNDTKDTWSILAKVLRKWSVKRKVAPYAVWKVGMLLVDEKGSRIEVSATHKNLIGKLKDEPREGMVYNFQNFSDELIFGETYNFKNIADIQQGNDQRRECDIIKRLNFSIADQSENTLNVGLWGDCTEETFGKKHEDMEPPITVLVRFARLNRNTDYGHLSNAFNATLVTLNPNIPEANLMKERPTHHLLVLAHVVPLPLRSRSGFQTEVGVLGSATGHNEDTIGVRGSAKFQRVARLIVKLEAAWLFRVGSVVLVIPAIEASKQAAMKLPILVCYI